MYVELKILELLNASSKNWYQIDRGLRARDIHLEDPLEVVLSNLKDEGLIFIVNKSDPNSNYCLTEKGKKMVKRIA